MNTHSFVAIDFETATAKRMACQIGIVAVTNGEVVFRHSGYLSAVAEYQGL